MFDQSFSAENYMTIFHEENRKGNIVFDNMPDAYRAIVGEIKGLQDRANVITRKKKKDRTGEEIQELEDLRLLIKEKQNDREQELYDEMYSYAEKVNVNNFSFPITFYVKDDKQIFTVNDSWENFYALKNLQRILRGLFDVKQDSRHSIMSNLRLLLNTSRPFYLIRTDVENFFESIPQDRLYNRIHSNNLINNKTKGLIKAILNEFNSQKDPTKFEHGCGVPRGIGISSYLSEIYMREIDQNIKSREEVVFYARYVDDIVIVLAGLPNNQKLTQYYKGLADYFMGYGLKLKKVSDPDKCKLIDYYNHSRNESVKYLGYTISLSKPRSIVAKFGMSDVKVSRIKGRIDAAFMRFENISAISLKQAERDLIDSLNLISGNYRLNKSKATVKAGLFFGSDLLTDFTDLSELTEYLHQKQLILYPEVLKGSQARDKYIDKIKRKIMGIDFTKRWTNKVMFKFSSQRLNEISSWL